MPTGQVRKEEQEQEEEHETILEGVREAGAGDGGTAEARVGAERTEGAEEGEEEEEEIKEQTKEQKQKKKKKKKKKKEGILPTRREICGWRWH